MIGKSKPEVESGELKICGLAAVRALPAGPLLDPAALFRLRDRPEDRDDVQGAGGGRREIYRCVEPGELEKIAGSIHHGGVVASSGGFRAGVVGPGDAAAWAGGASPCSCSIGLATRNLGAIARPLFLGCRAS